MIRSWETKRLNEVCQVRPPKKEAKEALSESDPVSFVPMKVLGEHQKYFDVVEDKLLLEVSSSYTYFKNNDVLLAKITPCFENGKLGIAKNLTNGIGFGSSEYIVYRTSEQLNPEFLYYFLSQESFRESGKSQMTGAVGHKRIPKEFYELSKIPIPPLKEQKQIVAILDQAFAAIDQAQANIQQNIQNAQDLFQSKLNQIFSQQGEGWEEKTLADICEFENGDRGKNYPSRSKFVEEGIPFVNAGHLENGRVQTEGMNYITESTYKLLSRGKFKGNDLLFCLRGSLGKNAIIQEGFFGAIASSLVIVRPNNLTIPEFVRFYFKSELCTKMIDKYAGGAAQPNLGAKDLMKFVISVPSLLNQEKLISDFENLEEFTDKIINKYQIKSLQLDELKKSLLQKAFSGELTQEKQAA